MKKLALAGLASALSLSLVGAGTFAAWSDFAVVDGNESGAGVLTLDLGAAGNGSLTFDVDDFVPGQVNERIVYVATSDSPTAPTAKLFMGIENLVDIEDGCSSDSEAGAQATGYAGTDCTSTSAPGQFSNQATIRISHSDPLPAPLPPSGGCPAMNQDSLPSAAFDAAAAGGRVEIGDLDAGQGYCILTRISLPATATNAVQGDSITYDVRFDLEQVI